MNNFVITVYQNLIVLFVTVVITIYVGMYICTYVANDSKLK